MLLPNKAIHLRRQGVGNEVKKRILQSIGLLGVNFVGGGLAVTGFFLFLFRGDPILAALPILVALPVILAQPWFIVFFFLPGGPLLAPALTTAVSIPLYATLDRRGKLDKAKLLFARLRNRRTATAIAVALMGMTVIGFARYVDFPALRRGIPGTLKHSLKDLKIGIQGSRSYSLGGFIDSEWLWQVHLSEQDVNRLTEKLGMRPIPADRVGDAYQRMPPYWWRPVVSDQVRVMATRDFPMTGRGSDGWHALATWNPQDKVLSMWIKENF